MTLAAVQVLRNMTGVRVLVNAVVVASVASALVIAPRALARRPGTAGPAARSVSPAVLLMLVTGLVYVNQVLFTVYVLRVHDGDASFIARYLPARGSTWRRRIRLCAAWRRSSPRPAFSPPACCVSRRSWNSPSCSWRS